MTTLLTDSPDEAAALLRSGEVVAFPTETVYGLGADAFNERGVRKIFVAKGRPPDNPLIVHVATQDQIAAVARIIPSTAQVLIEHFFPGPTTVIVPKHERVSDLVTGGLPTVGVRMPRHPVALALLEACGFPVAAPSANRSGRPSPTTWQAVRADLGGRIAAILRGSRSEAGLESTVVDCTGEVPLVLRAGVVTLEHLQAVLPGTRLAGSSAHEMTRSPGTRYRHYAPHARVHLVATPHDAVADPSTAYIGLDAPLAPARFGALRKVASPEQYAYELFDFFRHCDAAGIEMIFCQAVSPTGLGRALMDRLERAANG